MREDMTTTMEIPEVVAEIIEKKVRRAEARKEVSAKTSSLEMVLSRFGPISPDLEKRIDFVRDAVVLDSWSTIAVESDSFDSFRRNASFL